MPVSANHLGAVWFVPGNGNVNGNRNRYSEEIPPLLFGWTCQSGATEKNGSDAAKGSDNTGWEGVTELNEWAGIG